MTHVAGRHYRADEGKFIVHLQSGRICGDSIYLGNGRDISEYGEEPYTEESRAEFFKSIGMKDPRKRPEPPNKPNAGRIHGSGDPDNQSS